MSAPFHLPPRQTLLLILLPLLTTFACQRLYLHFVGVHHVYPGGYLVHHLFTGALMVIPAAFILAFGPRCRRTAVLTRVALGIGSAMVLDEVVYLVATRASDADYVSPLSLRGAFVFVSLGVILLWALYRIHPRSGEENS
ncbi:MAG TPA: hypothetical protein VHM91_15530 [Verrucomicrobiales bacterium]|nr:hypothetical protein [Verrucomicrobiales bacterium]